MTDYVGIVLQGFSTGIGVIIAHECYDYFKNHRLNKFIDAEIKRLREIIR